MPSFLSPTATGLFLATPVDAAFVLARAMAGVWPALHRHLNGREERKVAVRSGNVVAFVKTPTMDRWRDGLSWSDSRAGTGGFNIFRQKGAGHERCSNEELENEKRGRESLRPFMSSLSGWKEAKRGGLFKKSITFVIGPETWRVIGYYAMTDIRDRRLARPPRDYTLPLLCWHQPPRTANQIGMLDDGGVSRVGEEAGWVAHTETTEPASEVDECLPRDLTPAESSSGGLVAFVFLPPTPTLASPALLAPPSPLPPSLGPSLPPSLPPAGSQPAPVLVAPQHGQLLAGPAPVLPSGGPQLQQRQLHHPQHQQHWPRSHPVGVQGHSQQPPSWQEQQRLLQMMQQNWDAVLQRALEQQAEQQQARQALLQAQQQQWQPQQAVSAEVPPALSQGELPSSFSPVPPSLLSPSLLPPSLPSPPPPALEASASAAPFPAAGPPLAPQVAASAPAPVPASAAESADLSALAADVAPSVAPADGAAPSSAAEFFPEFVDLSGLTADDAPAVGSADAAALSVPTADAAFSVPSADAALSVPSADAAFSSPFAAGVFFGASADDALSFAAELAPEWMDLSALRAANAAPSVGPAPVPARPVAPADLVLSSAGESFPEFVDLPGPTADDLLSVPPVSAPGSAPVPASAPAPASSSALPAGLSRSVAPAPWPAPDDPLSTVTVDSLLAEGLFPDGLGSAPGSAPVVPAPAPAPTLADALAAIPAAELTAAQAEVATDTRLLNAFTAFLAASSLPPAGLQDEQAWTGPPPEMWDQLEEEGVFGGVGADVAAGAGAGAAGGVGVDGFVAFGGGFGGGHFDPDDVGELFVGGAGGDAGAGVDAGATVEADVGGSGRGRGRGRGGSQGRGRGRGRGRGQGRGRAQ